MRDKVVHNTSTLTTTASTNSSTGPTNILQPNLLISSTLSSSSITPASTPDNAYSSTDPSQSSALSNTFDAVTPLQPTAIVDNTDLLNSFDSSSYTTLQSCPLDLRISHRSKNKRLSTSPIPTCKSRRKRGNNGEHAFT